MFLVAGIFQFENAKYPVKESSGEVEIDVLRQHGSDGKVRVRWKTISGSATSGTDYTHRNSLIIFQSGEVWAIIKPRQLLIIRLSVSDAYIETRNKECYYMMLKC